MVKNFSCFSDQMSEWERNVIFDVMPDRVGSVTQKLLISWDFHSRQSLEFTGNDAKYERHPCIVNESGQRRTSFETGSKCK